MIGAGDVWPEYKVRQTSDADCALMGCYGECRSVSALYVCWRVDDLNGGGDKAGFCVFFVHQRVFTAPQQAIWWFAACWTFNERTADKMILLLLLRGQLAPWPWSSLFPWGIASCGGVGVIGRGIGCVPVFFHGCWGFDREYWSVLRFISGDVVDFLGPLF